MNEYLILKSIFYFVTLFSSLICLSFFVVLFYPSFKKIYRYLNFIALGFLFLAISYFIEAFAPAIGVIWLVAMKIFSTIFIFIGALREFVFNTEREKRDKEIFLIYFLSAFVLILLSEIFSSIIILSVILKFIGFVLLYRWLILHRQISLVNKIFISIISGFIVLGFIILSVTQIFFSTYLQKRMIDQGLSALHYETSLIEFKEQELLLESEKLSSDDNFKEAFKNSNQEQLQSIIKNWNKNDFIIVLRDQKIIASDFRAESSNLEASADWPEFLSFLEKSSTNKGVLAGEGIPLYLYGYSSIVGTSGGIIFGHDVRNNEIVDKVKKDNGSDATIVLGEIRISTTLKDKNNVRLNNSFYPLEEFKKATLKEDKSYVGIEEMGGGGYALGAASPIHDFSGKTVGILGAGFIVSEISDVPQMINYMILGIFLGFLFFLVLLYLKQYKIFRK